jgi:hypothetical protein
MPRVGGIAAALAVLVGALAIYAAAAPQQSAVRAASPLGRELPTPLRPSRGKVYYVSPRGSDSNRGTARRPWRRIQHALGRLRPGQRVLVRAGVYEENLVMTRAGTPAKPITIAAYPRERPVLRPSPSSPSYPIELDTGAAYVRVSGFLIENAVGSSTTNVYVAGRAHHIEISRNEIRGSQQHGIFTDPTTSDVQMLRNSIHDNGKVTDRKQDHGIYVEGRRQLIANNLIFDQPHGWGIQVYPNSTNVIVTANTIVGNSLGGIVVGGNGKTAANATTIVNNVVAFNAREGIRGYYPSAGGPAGSGNRAFNNIAFANPHGNFVNDRAPSTVLDFSEDNAAVNPRFVNRAAHDYRLGSRSPALDRAFADFSPRADYSGRLRPQGKAADLGALERRR